MNRWNTVAECNDEDGRATCWSLEINSTIYGKYVWITENTDGFDIEVCPENDFCILRTCRSLRSAKKWVNTHIISREQES